MQIRNKLLLGFWRDIVLFIYSNESVNSEFELYLYLNYQKKKKEKGKDTLCSLPSALVFLKDDLCVIAEYRISEPVFVLPSVSHEKS